MKLDFDNLNSEKMALENMKASMDFNLTNTMSNSNTANLQK